MNALQNLAQLTSSQIVNCFVLGIGIAALAGVGSAVAGRRSSGIRFAIWFAAIVVIGSLFFLPRSIVHSAAAVHITAPEISLRPDWALYILAGWGLFAAIGLARIVRGLWRLRSLKQSCVPLDARLATSLQQTSPSGSRKFELRVSERLRVPAALGFFRPVVVLPVWAVRELSHEELQTVVLHEAAHLLRWDDWTNLLQKIIRALLFFHPAVWWIDSRLSIEREMSCDDLVLARFQNAHRYAACLVSLAEKAHAQRSLALVQAAVSHLRHTAQRITRILDGDQRTVKPLLRPALAAVTAFSVIGFVAVQHAPQLVSFRESAAPVQTASSNKFDYVAGIDTPAAKAVPASLHLSNSPVATRTKAVPQRNKAPRPLIKQNVNRPAVQVEEAHKQFSESKPAIVNAALSDHAVPRFVYLVTQTEHFDEFGNVIVTTSVWRIQLVKPVPAAAQNTAAPHQT